MTLGDALSKMRPMGLFATTEAKRLAAIFAVVVVGGAAMAVSLVPPAPPPAAEIPMPTLRVAGQPLPTTGDPVGNALDLVRRYALGDAKLVLPNGKSIKLTRADFGIEIDRMRLAEFVKAALEKGSPLQRAHALHDAASPLDVPIPIQIDTDRATKKLVDIKADIDTAPVDAVIDLDGRKVKPEVVGYQLDVYGTLARMEAAFRSGSNVVQASVEEVAPKRRAAQLDGVVFDHVLGSFETHYNIGKKYEDRTYNLRLAASKLDGTVVMPGEIFDFNAVVGPRDEAHGYKVAKVIAEGELVDGIGGGTCQISGTLHGAAFFSGLDVVERYPHSRPSGYIKLGLDATVAYPNITYRFRNPFDFPVVLHEKVAAGTVRAEILGPQRKLTVSYFRRIDEVLPFEETERETPKLAKGERVVVQRGIPGFRATASRVVRDGAYGDRTKWTEKYPPTTQIVDIGTGADDEKAGVVEDPHPEYTVDEYLVVTQGPNIHTSGESSDPEGGTAEQRFPGKTGEAGWMKKLGLEKTPIESKGTPDDAGNDPSKDKTKSKGDDKKASSDGDKKSKDKKDKSKKDTSKKDNDKKDGKKAKES